MKLRAPMKWIVVERWFNPTAGTGWNDLVDEFGSYDEAVAVAKEMAKANPDNKFAIMEGKEVYFTEKKVKINKIKYEEV